MRKADHLRRLFEAVKADDGPIDVARVVFPDIWRRDANSLLDAALAEAREGGGRGSKHDRLLTAVRPLVTAIEAVRLQLLETSMPLDLKDRYHRHFVMDELPGSYLEVLVAVLEEFGGE